MDTGNISIVRPDVLSELEQVSIRPVRSCLRTVTGEQAPIHGKGQLQLGMGSLVIPQELWVADIHDECILGLDFLQSHDCRVDLNEGSLTIGEEEIPLRSASELVCHKAVLTEEVHLPALSETVVSVQMQDTKPRCGWGLLECSKVPDGLLVARTLADLQRDQVPLRVANLSQNPQVVKKGTELAQCEAVKTPRGNTGEERIGVIQSVEIVKELPSHLKELYDHSIIGLAKGECKQVHRMLCEFSRQDQVVQTWLSITSILVKLHQ